MITRVLVPLDGSANAAAAWPYGRLIAKACGAEIEVLRVVEPFMDMARSRMIGREPISEAPPPVTDDISFEQLRVRQEQIKQAAQADLDRIAKEASAEGTPVTTIVREGHPADVIIDEAGSQDGTLICMGTHGRSGIARWLYGSVADRVIHHAESSTLVVRSKENEKRPPGAIRRVILPVDGSEVSERAIPMAVDIARSLGVGITVLRALDLDLEGTIPASGVDEFPVLNMEKMRAESQSYVDDIAKRVHDLGITDCDTRIVDERPAQAIVDEVGEGGDKLVVMGSHGRSGATRWLLGSVSDNVVRHSAGPVLIVRRA
jgi:nucleotide-binding universal stress UspA family protein